MRAPRLLAVATVALGAGLVSGSATQVAALDGDLRRAAESTQPGHKAPAARRPDGKRFQTEQVRCLRHRSDPPPGRST